MPLDEYRCQAGVVGPATYVEVLARQIVYTEHVFSKCMVEVAVPISPNHGCHLYLSCLHSYDM